MNVDTDFIKELKELDDKLDVGWNHIKNRFQIVRSNQRMKYAGRLKGKPLFVSYSHPYLVLTVENENGSFRPLDGRTIDKLHSIDVYSRYPRIKDFIMEIENSERDYKERKERRQSEMRQEIAKDNFHRLRDGLEEMRGISNVKRFKR